MKIMLIILNFVGISPWLLLTSIVAMVKIQINNLKNYFLNLESNNLSRYKILSKIHNRKYICKRYYGTRKSINKNYRIYYVEINKHNCEKMVVFKTIIDLKEILEYIKDKKINLIYTNKISSDPLVSIISVDNFKSILENKYECKDLINLTANITKDKDFDKLLFIIAKDLENKKTD